MTVKLSFKMDHSVIEAFLTGSALAEWNELKAATVEMEEALEDVNSDRLQLLEAVRFSVDLLPETSHNLRVRARLEMSLTDLVTVIVQEEN